MSSEKSSLTRLILEKLKETGELTLQGLFPEHRIEAKIWRQALGLPNKYEFSAKTFSVILTRLKKQGLVAKSGPERKSLWSLTKEGETSLVDVVDSSLPEEDGIMRLVMFDIPETERRKRDLLRLELTACGYRQLQRSVWMGYRPLPEKFINSLDDLELKKKVHIVSIDKQGTLETI